MGTDGHRQTAVVFLKQYLSGLVCASVCPLRASSTPDWKSFQALSRCSECLLSWMNERISIVFFFLSLLLPPFPFFSFLSGPAEEPLANGFGLKASAWGFAAPHVGLVFKLGLITGLDSRARTWRVLHTAILMVFASPFLPVYCNAKWHLLLLMTHQLETWHQIKHEAMTLWMQMLRDYERYNDLLIHFSSAIFRFSFWLRYLVVTRLPDQRGISAKGCHRKWCSFPPNIHFRALPCLLKPYRVSLYMHKVEDKPNFPCGFSCGSMPLLCLWYPLTLWAVIINILHWISVATLVSHS